LDWSSESAKVPSFAAAAGARIWVKGGVDLASSLWFLIAFLLLLVAHKVLYLLEAPLEDFP